MRAHDGDNDWYDNTSTLTLTHLHCLEMKTHCESQAATHKHLLKIAPHCLISFLLFFFCFFLLLLDFFDFFLFFIQFFLFTIKIKKSVLLFLHFLFLFSSLNSLFQNLFNCPFLFSSKYNNNQLVHFFRYRLRFSLFQLRLFDRCVFFFVTNFEI